MGFGLLFLGYFALTFMSWHTFGSLVQCLGYGLILLAMLKLRRYERAFDFGLIGSVVMLCVTAFLAVGDVSDFLYENLYVSSRLFSDGMRSVASYVDTAAFFLFHAFLLWGVRVIAHQTEVFKIESNAIRNFIFFFLYSILAMSVYLPMEALNGIRPYLMLFSVVLYFICSVLNLMLFASCYARICDEEDAEMAQKPSRFAFVNRMRARSEEVEQRNFESGQAYRHKRDAKKKRKGTR